MQRAASHHDDPRKSASSNDRAAHNPRYIFNRASVREVDRLAVEEFAMPGVVLMENAARGAAQVALDMLASALEARRTPRVAIVCGPGNNGGDGYAIARWLHNAGCDVTLHPLASPKDGTDAAINAGICKRMQLTMSLLNGPDALRSCDLIIDAILGTGLTSDVKGETATIIDWINQSNRPVLAIDVPSGMDCDTGKALGVCIKATHTVTFVGEKKGFESLDAQKLLGEVTVVDIGVPKELLARLGNNVEPSRRRV